MPPALRRTILLAAAAATTAVLLLWPAACVADDDGTTFPPSAFPFCPTRPAGVSTGPFPWSPPPSSVAVFPQDPGFLTSDACAVPRLPLLAVFSVLLVFLQ